MPVQLICCSHSPLMTAEMEESQQGVQAQFFREMDTCAAALHKFDPDLVVVFGPDHFNGFFYELMPAFCIGTAAEATRDWHLEGGPLRVPRELALACVRHLQAHDFDVALSHAMKVDHGITIPLFKLTGALTRYSVLPVFINWLSHDPPTPRIDHSEPDATARLVNRHTPTQDDYDARENRVIKAARELVDGGGPCLPPSEQWDRDFLQSFVGAKLEDLDRMSDAEIDQVAGFGAHEVRTWVAAAAAAQQMGQLQAELRYYHLVPEWITGMGIVVGRA